MAEHQDNCTICKRLVSVREEAAFIAETETGIAVMGSQFFRGYCMFLCKTAATELDDLPLAFRRQYLDDMTRWSQAVRVVVQPHKLNIELLGNIVPHLHWHIFPRRQDEKNAAKPVWLSMPPDYEDVPHAFDPTRDASLRDAIRAAFERLSESY